MPPTVAQTAPAFADVSGDGVPVSLLNANFASRAEYDDRRMLPTPLPPVAQDFVEELFLNKSFESRALFKQLEDEWTRRVLLPTPPTAFDDGEASRAFTEKRFWLDSELLLGMPFALSTGWLDDSAMTYASNRGTLAAMVVLDEFVSAPAGGGTFGSAPRGRSARFGFVVPLFR